MDQIQAVKEIFTTGNSLVISLTKELRMMELGKGDKVKVTLERITE